MEPTTDGTLLGGRLTYRQFRHGYRTGLEPILLAAGVPAQPGQRVLEAGCGAGAGLMCLCARISRLEGVGVEADPGTAALARYNWSRNGLGLKLHETLLADLPEEAGLFDHAFANPPWHRARASASPFERRDLARRAQPGLLDEWVTTLADRLRPGGTLTLILPAALHAQASGLMRGLGRLGGITLLPFWPKQGMAAKIVLMQGRRGSLADAAVLPGLVLHQAGGSYTEAAEAILRGGQALDIAPGRGHLPAPEAP
jgi:tRNA1(Val) A37 N6-methylase TrmN6